MTLEILHNDMIAAMKSKDITRKSVLSSCIGAVKNAAIAKQCKDNITEELVNEVLLKEQKTIQEQIDTCPPDRIDMLEEYKCKYSIIKEYAPQIITDEDAIHEMVNELLAGADGIDATNKGLVMKYIMPKLKGKVDMKIAQRVLTKVTSKNA